MNNKLEPDKDKKEMEVELITIDQILPASEQIFEDTGGSMAGFGASSKQVAQILKSV